MLQNRYGDHEFPVRNRWSNVRLYRQAALQHDPRRAARRSLLWVAPAALVLVATFGITANLNHGADGPESDLAFMIGLAVFALLVVLGLVVGGLIDRRVPRREQERYLALTGASRAADISEHQQQLLALDAQSDYAIGGWNSSLDYAPAWSRMPADLQRAHEQGAKRPPFVTMPLFETDALRAKLDQDEHIASRADVELFVADALNDRSFSARFRQILHGPDGERMLARVSSLTGVSEWDLRALEQPDGGLPPRLLWAADTQHVIAVVRTAYLADHLDPETAWRLIEHAAAPGTALFDGWDAYWANVRVGLAFWTDRLEAVQNFDRSLAGLRRSDWPAASAAFPRMPVPAWLPVFTDSSASTPNHDGA